MIYQKYAYPQCGAGIGNIFKTLVRVTTPLVKKVVGSALAKRLTRRALQVGSEEFSRFADDILEGKNIKKSVKSRVVGALKRVQSGNGVRGKTTSKKQRGGAVRGSKTSKKQRGGGVKRKGGGSIRGRGRKSVGRGNRRGVCNSRYDIFA